ncbi:hypothetical protein BG015_009700 [Linnemannia schmuckeri]|uniref:rRNA methyltransferase 1, mitochondrial n=1 Tax=Linnemannia schmuckeri TaxID=64567 RepID=A0A9P5V9R9_9FUNG|nr:hypothetical protein BG015_009700 [Linnemannia schmuckeri]
MSTILAETPFPPVTPKISKYRVDCNTSKVIKRRKKKGNEDGKKAIPHVVRSKPVANPRKVRLAAEAATREIMRKMQEAEASAAAAAPSLATTVASPPKPSALFYTRKPSIMKSESATTVVTDTPLPSTIEPTARDPALRIPEPVTSRSRLPSLSSSNARRIPEDQPPQNLDPVLSTLVEAVATQPAPISSGWSTRSPLQSYRLPLPELTDQSEQRYSTLDPLPKMATSIERRPSQAPQRIKRSVYRTILDWSVHPTIQPNDFNTLPDLPQITPLHTGHSVKSSSTNAAATSGQSKRSTTATASTSDEGVAKRRYVSRRRIGFDDDDHDFDQRPYHPGQSTTQVLDTIVHNRINKSNTDTQSNPWSISGIMKQKFVPNNENFPKSVLLKKPVITRTEHSDDDGQKKYKDETAKNTAAASTSKPTQSTLPWKKLERADQTLQRPIVLPDQPLLGSWIDSPRRRLEKTAESTQKSAYCEYVFSPKSVLPALKTRLRKPYELLYTDSNIHPRVLQMVQECVKTAGEMGLKVVKATPDRLDTLLGHKYHQGVLLRASYLPRALIKSLGTMSEDNNKYDLNFIRGTAKPFDRPATSTNNSSNGHRITSGKAATGTLRTSSPPIWVVLDEVQTVYDMGHILSTAYHLGIDGVIIREKDTVLPHAAVSAVSEGTLEKRPAYAVKTLVKFIKESQANGWQVIGLKAAYGSKRLKPFYTFPKHGIDQPTVLIVGGSGVGISKSAERQCDSFIHIPTLSRMAMSFGEVASLPVPVVSGIAMSRLVGGRLAAAGSDNSDWRAGGGGGVEEYDRENNTPDPWIGSPPEWEVPVPKSKGKGNQVGHTRNDTRR